MIPHLVYYQLVILVLLWLYLMLPHLWPSPPGGAPQDVTVQVVKTGITPQRTLSDGFREAKTEPLPPIGRLHMRR